MKKLNVVGLDGKSHNVWALDDEEAAFLKALLATVKDASPFTSMMAGSGAGILKQAAKAAADAV